MKKYNYINGIFAVLLLTSPLADAGTKYPAADFQPKVLYNDPSYQPGSSASSSKGERSEADPNYPAANFQPKVLYKDENYKPGKATTRVARSSVSSSANTAAPATAGEQQADDSSQTFLLGLGILAVVGWFFYNKTRSTGSKPKPAPRARRREAPEAASGALTGVARYLNEKMPATTGVAKYLQSKESTPVSGVAKYVAKQVLREREAAAAKVTGVEKYLRDRS